MARSFDDTTRRNIAELCAAFTRAPSGEAEPTLDVFSIGLTYRWDTPAVPIPAAPVVRKY